MNHKRVSLGSKTKLAAHLPRVIVIVIALFSTGTAGAQRPAQNPGQAHGQAPAQREAAVKIPTRRPDGKTGPVEGHGKWRAHAGNPQYQRHNARRLPDGPPETKNWSARLTHHADKSVTGDFSLDIAGQKLIRHGNVRGRAERGRFWGDVLDDDGHPAATFEAGMGANGIEGTYTTVDGEMGSFTWDGTLALPTPGEP